MANHRGGSGNFAEDRERASEAGRKGGQHSGGNFKNDPQRASEAGKKGGKNSHGSRERATRTVLFDAVLISPTQPHRPRRRHLPAVFLSVGGCAPAGRSAHWSPVNRHGCLMSSLKFSVSRQEALLIMITMFWGGTFLAVQYAVSLSGPLFFVGLRFATAALAVGLLSLRTLRGLTWLEVKAGVAIGVAIALGYGLQTWGLQTISSSKSAFITAMYVPLVPLLQWLCLGRMPGVMSCVGIVLAFIGLILLAGPENNLLALGVGEMITLASALAIAAEIILISAWAGKVDVRRVTVVQLATASLVAFAAMKPAGESVPSLTPALLGVALGLGIFSAIIQVTMNWAQRSVSPTRATLIYTGEPVWAGIFGRLAGERLPLLALLGCVLILAGVLVSELKWKRKSPPQVSTNDDAQPLTDLADRREP